MFIGIRTEDNKALKAIIDTDDISKMSPKVFGEKWCISIKEKGKGDIYFSCACETLDGVCATLQDIFEAIDSGDKTYIL